MSSLDLEQSVAAQKASLEDPFDILNKALESIEKLTSLSLWAFKIILAKTQEITASGLSAKDSQELLSLQAQTAVNETQSSWHLRP
ncbi:hypothetical protein PPGU19_097280 (plasmid) [Paraburkholderia sp. PGU19]|uniref:phasin family protein n=1 Tax=Paraburkholderia sp. PGU19 TaxID=2735434 RepID=UPI0015D97ECC|nr:phasin family protein [Paraburkholderia sp. PGU19]BCG05160.1 hypothetical protein PPGU19_097280 [Paraburkholderia sp. PGU19]